MAGLGRWAGGGGARQHCERGCNAVQWVLKHACRSTGIFSKGLHMLDGDRSNYCAPMHMTTQNPTQPKNSDNE